MVAKFQIRNFTFFSTIKISEDNVVNNYIFYNISHQIFSKSKLLIFKTDNLQRKK